MKHLLHLSKLWIVCHFMFIQTIDVACIWKYLLWFLTPLCYLYGYHYGLLLFSFYMFPQFVQYLSIFPVLLCVFGGATYLVLCCTKSALLAFAIIMPSSHNITTFLCCCSVNNAPPSSLMDSTTSPKVGKQRLVEISQNVTNPFTTTCDL